MGKRIVAEVKKTSELARFIAGKLVKLDFTEPYPFIQRVDNRELRLAISTVTIEQARKAGINKSTLYALRQRVRDGRQFRLYGKVRTKLLQVPSR
jgi:hypothetical protein